MVAIDAPGPAQRDDTGGVELLDDGRAGDDRADVEPVALVEPRLNRIPPVEMDAALALDRNAARTGRRGWFLCTRLVFRHRHPHAHAIAHHLDRPFLRSMPMNLRMALIESVASGGE